MIHLAKVISNFDFTRTGKVRVQCKELDLNQLEVIYTTPYYSNWKAGIFAPPAEGSEILIHVDQSTGFAYYLSTVIASPIITKKYQSPDPDNRRLNPVINVSQLYQDGSPGSMTFKNNQKDGLQIDSKRATDRIINKTVLNSGKKALRLDSSPEVDCVRLENGHGDYLKITGLPESSIGIPSPPKRSLEARTFLNQNFVSDRGGIDLMINDGKDITIENRSSGFFGMSSIFGPRSGNVNLFTKYKNINLIAKAPPYVPIESLQHGGKIFLETANSSVVVSRTGVTIRLNTSVIGTPPAGAAIAGVGGPKIEVKTTGEILIDAGGTHTIPPSTGGLIKIRGGDLALIADRTITLTAGTAINLQSVGQINVNGTNVNVDGLAGIFLNSNLSSPAVAAAATVRSLLDIPVNITPSDYPLGTKFF